MDCAVSQAMLPKSVGIELGMHPVFVDNKIIIQLLISQTFKTFM